MYNLLQKYKKGIKTMSTSNLEPFRLQNSQKPQFILYRQTFASVNNFVEQRKTKEIEIKNHFRTILFNTNGGYNFSLGKLLQVYLQQGIAQDLDSR